MQEKTQHNIAVSGGELFNAEEFKAVLKDLHRVHAVVRDTPVVLSVTVPTVLQSKGVCNHAYVRQEAGNVLEGNRGSVYGVLKSPHSGLQFCGLALPGVNCKYCSPFYGKCKEFLRNFIANYFSGLGRLRTCSTSACTLESKLRALG